MIKTNEINKYLEMDISTIIKEYQEAKKKIVELEKEKITKNNWIERLKQKTEAEVANNKELTNATQRKARKTEILERNPIYQEYGQRLEDIKIEVMETEVDYKTIKMIYNYLVENGKTN